MKLEIIMCVPMYACTGMCFECVGTHWIDGWMGGWM